MQHSKASPLPVPLHRFIQRPEQALLLDYLQDNRLITVVGYGGAGKSRLALEVARECQDSFEVRFVALEAILEPADVPSAILRAFGEEPKSEPLEQLKTRIGQEKPFAAG
ncbi:MAG: hypothetical protein HC781_23050 [Leptolyngbyaceae cyanobacterium CSU_1_4]|nr:hypothetical protein [Leptolyngbyaceae cyanobacterium CSU_1_4]